MNPVTHIPSSSRHILALSDINLEDVSQPNAFHDNLHLSSTTMMTILIDMHGCILYNNNKTLE